MFRWGARAGAKVGMMSGYMIAGEDQRGLGAAGDGDWRRVLRGAAAQERWLWRVSAASGGEQMKMRQLGRAEGRCRG